MLRWPTKILLEQLLVEEHSTQILFQIFVIFTAAKLMGIVGERFGVPAVISEIVAGILIGPHLLNLVHIEEWTLALAGLGAIILLFDVGLNQKLTDMLKVGKTALAVANAGVVVPFFLGYGLMLLAGYGQHRQTVALQVIHFIEGAKEAHLDGSVLLGAVERAAVAGSPVFHRILPQQNGHIEVVLAVAGDGKSVLGARARPGTLSRAALGEAVLVHVAALGGVTLDAVNRQSGASQPLFRPADWSVKPARCVKMTD